MEGNNEWPSFMREVRQQLTSNIDESLPDHHRKDVPEFRQNQFDTADTKSHHPASRYRTYEGLMEISSLTGVRPDICLLSL